LFFSLPFPFLQPYAGILSLLLSDFITSADAAFTTAAVMTFLAVAFFQVRVLLNFREDVTEGLERPDAPEVY
jgi:hypothetical protein